MRTRRQMRRRVLMTIAIVALTAGVMVLPAGNEPAFAGVKAPAKVTGLTMKVNAQPTATLQWKAGTKGADGYVVYRNGKKLAKVKKGASAYVDRTLKPGASYTYTVKAYRKKGTKTAYSKPSAAGRISKGYTWAKAPGGKTRVTGYTGHKADLTIPTKLGGKKVTEIGKEAFRGNLWISRLTIPEGVKIIDDYAFETCSGVNKVYFPKSLKTIGKGAFSGCAQMRLADLGDRVTSIGDGAFLYCKDLAYIDLPADLESLGQFAFAGSGIGSAIFSGNRITSLPDRVFCNCENLTRVDLPPTVTAVGKRAFYGCSRLDFPLFYTLGTVRIGDYAFEKCDRLEVPTGSRCSIHFGKGAFARANGPREDGIQIQFPDGTTFEEGAFFMSAVDGITTVSQMGGIPDGSTGSDGIKLVDGSLLSGDGKVLLAYFPKAFDSKSYKYVKTKAAEEGIYRVPEGVETIASYAFYRSQLKTVYLPSSVREIRANAFTMSDVDRSGVQGIGSVGTVSEAAFEGSAIEKGGTVPGITDTVVDRNAEGPYPLTSDGVSFDPAKYSGYLDISEDQAFEAWIESYKKYNKDLPLTASYNPYLALYTGNDHYQQMVSALNHDAHKTEESIKASGDDYVPMYLMIDHGLISELTRGRMPEDLVLYSGITPERVSDIAGVPRTEDLTRPDRYDEMVKKLISRIGTETTDDSFMSTTANLSKALSFGDYAKVVVKIYASRDAMDRLGTVCVDPFSAFSGEQEVLFNPLARYRILDVTKFISHETFLSEKTRDETYTCITMELQ